MIDVTYLQQTYEREELANVGLVRSAANVADGLSKSDGVLLRILRTGTLRAVLYRGIVLCVHAVICKHY
jgi:hypothetical protein